MQLKLLYNYNCLLTNILVIALVKKTHFAISLYQSPQKQSKTYKSELKIPSEEKPNPCRQSQPQRPPSRN